jgi:SAM-dependent methyltransferase
VTAGLIQAMAAANVHETAANMLDKARHSRIIDLPCGGGALIQKLLDLGYSNVLGGDIDADLVLVRDKVPFVQLDLNRRTPFGDGKFDAIICLECIEHLENPFHLIRELTRILAPDGELILSTPNVLSATARSKFLTAGYYPHFADLACRWKRVTDAGPQGHLMPVPLNWLLFMAHLSRLRLTALRTNKLPRRRRLKDRLIALLVKMVSRRFYDENLYRLLVSDEVLYGDILVAKFAKQ